LQFNLGCRQFTLQILDDVFVVPGQLYGHLDNPHSLEGGAVIRTEGPPRAPGKEPNRHLILSLLIEIRLSEMSAKPRGLYCSLRG
jgi:hypothetical protein